MTHVFVSTGVSHALTWGLTGALTGAVLAHPPHAQQTIPPPLAPTATFPVKLGTAALTYESVPGWCQLPDTRPLGNTHGAIVIDRAGLVYFNTDTDRSIMVYTPDGVFVRSFAADYSGIHGMTIRVEDGVEYLYAAHLHGKQVVKFRLDGTVVWTLPVPMESGKYDDDPNAYNPTAVAVGPSGDIYVADGYGRNWIHHFASDRTYVRSFGGPGAEPGRFNTCHGLAVDPRGATPTLIVCDRENRRLQRFNLDGTFVEVVATDLRRPCAVSFHGDEIAVAELEGRVTVLGADHAPLVHLGDNPRQREWANNGVKPEAWTEGVFTAPHGCCFDRSGNLYVMDWNASGRISKLRRVANGTASAASFDAIDTTLAPMRGLIERYDVDRSSLARVNDAPMSFDAATRRGAFERGWLDHLARVDFDALDHDGRIDYLLLKNLIEFELFEVAFDERRWTEMTPLLPFAETIVDLHEARRRFEPVDPATTASVLVDLLEVVESTRETYEDKGDAAPDVSASVAYRAGRMTRRLRKTLESWYEFSAGYDPMFSWWVKAPYDDVDTALRDHAGFLQEKLAGIDPKDDDALIGDPIGREALIERLEHAMIPYTPEELVAIAEREYAWCRAERLRASRELGFGDDWRAALDHVKTLYVDPGDQPALIADQAIEAIEFLEARDLVTIPALCRETWRMEMMSPARQKISPYFLGGETIIVSFPTDGMDHADKLMSMRGNNIHFSRAVVHHELIPGHHLQGFMTQRHRTHRQIFSTPFWGEGWALYWEMLLWDLGFAETPENRLGMLFWRTHRCARIVFSLSFHLGTMTAEEAVDYLVENVGHERNNAEAEVRRSIRGDYGPLYQAAYMLGGLQIRALHEELVTSGQMTNRAFHDAVLQQNSIPIELLRAGITGQPVTRDFKSTWRFYGEVE